MEIAAKDPNSDGLLVILSPQWMTSPSEIATSLKPFAKLHGKPVLASWMGGDQVAEGERILNDAGIPTFPFPDTAAHVFNYMWRYSFNLRSLYETPAYPEDAPEIDAAGARQVIGKAGSEGRVLLTEAESSQVLAAYDIPVAETRVAGSELTLGSRVDPQFGPVILFSAGGECALGLPPLNTTLARRLMEQTRIYKALPDPDALEQLVVRFSQLVTEQRWIQEIDVNPREARIVLHHPNRLESELPKTAIRPYPSQYVTQWKAKDGTAITIRPIRPEDEPMMVRFHETLSDESVYFRYFHLIKLGQRIEHERLTRQCFVDYNRDMALVAERDDPETGQRAIVAVGRMNKLHGVNEAEVAVIVSDRHQKMGLGTQLVTSLLAIARKEKLSRLVASVLPGNRGMQQVFEGLGFQMKYSPEEEVVQAELTL
jgi:RimJ/RimL family protein N-acetyltransferase